MELLYALEAIRTPTLDRLMCLITNLGGEIAFMVIALSIYWCLDKREGCYLLIVGFGGTLISQFLKLAFRIPRPWVQDPNFTIVEAARESAGGYSFPSGHTQDAVTVFGCIGRWHNNRLCRLLCLAAIVLVGLSRMYLGVHTPLDVGAAALLGLVLVLGLYPLFRRLDQHPSWMYLSLGVLVGMNVLYLLYVGLWPFPADADADNLREGIESGWKLLGAGMGMVLGYWLDQTRVHFDPKAPLPAQILKVALGLGLLLVIKEVLKAPLLALFGGHNLAHALRYGVMVVFAAAIWPMTFPWLSRLGRRNAQQRRERHEHG